MDAANEKKLMALVSAAVVTHEKLRVQLEEIVAVLNAEPSIGAQAKDLVGWFVQAWGQKYRGQTYVPTWGKDIASMKRLLKALTTVEIETAITRFLKSPDPFYANARHPLALFVGSVNKFTGNDALDDETFLQAPVVDCRHTPKCKSDQEHTRRRQADLRNPVL